MLFEKPKKFKRKPDKPKEPEHDFGYGFWYGDVPCLKCGRLMSSIEKTGARCATDEEIHAGQVFRRVTR